MLQTFHIRMSTLMSSEMTPFIRSRSNNTHWFLSDVGIFALRVAFPCVLGLPFGASLLVENESTSDALALWYSFMLPNKVQRERTKLYRLLGVFWNMRDCFVQVSWCRESWGWWWCVKFGSKRQWRWRQEDGIYILKFLPFLGLTCFAG